MAIYPQISEVQIEQIARVVGNAFTGSDISRAFAAKQLNDLSGESTKWKRLYWMFCKLNNEGKSCNQILGFIATNITPSRYVNNPEVFKNILEDLNLQLAFIGLSYHEDGKYRKISKATTISEAEKRVNTIQTKLKGRTVHHEVLKYCSIELMQDNYFHAIFEATKGLAQRIRDISGVEKDGSALVDACFSIRSPVLAFNTLTTESEQSEHKGIANLLKGCFGAIRNPLAHEPKVLWEGEEDAADFFSMLSLLHRKLDNAIVVSS